MIDIFNITTVGGKIFDELPFLTDYEHDEFNCIGYSGKLYNGVKTTYQEYLNSLNKGEFKVTKTKFDDGSFEEGYFIVWVH